MEWEVRLPELAYRPARPLAKAGGVGTRRRSCRSKAEAPNASGRGFAPRIRTKRPLPAIPAAVIAVPPLIITIAVIAIARSVRITITVSVLAAVVLFVTITIVAAVAIAVVPGTVIIAALVLAIDRPVVIVPASDPALVLCEQSTAKPDCQCGGCQYPFKALHMALQFSLDLLPHDWMKHARGGT